MIDPPPSLSRTMIDRVAHRRNDTLWLDEAWLRARVVLLDREGRTPLRSVGGVPVLGLTTAADLDPSAVRRLLGVVDDVPYFAATVASGTGWSGLREVAPVVDDVQAALLATAVALELWHGRHTHCPLCGTPTGETSAGWTRTCPVDDSQHFPRTDPAVIMLVHDGAGRTLLGRGASWGAGRFSTLAGFVEPGESLEAAVAREVAEEVGVEVHDVRYVASQPWPFPSSIMLGFTARADSSRPVEVDADELVEAGWFSRDDVRRAARWADEGLAGDDGAVLRGISPKLSISRFLIDGWLDGTLP